MTAPATRQLSLDGSLKHGKPVHLDIEMVNPFD